MGRYCNCGKGASGRFVVCEFCISKDRMKLHIKELVIIWLIKERNYECR